MSYSFQLTQYRLEPPEVLHLSQTSRLGTLVRHYIQVTASSISCVKYVNALGVSVKEKCWLDYANFGNMLPF